MTLSPPAHARPWRGRRVPSAGSPRRPRAERQRWPVSTARLSLSRRQSRYFLLRRVFRRCRRGPCSSPAGARPLSVFRNVRSHIRATFQKEPLPSLCDLPPWRPVARGPRSPSSREPLHLSAASRVARGPCPFGEVRPAAGPEEGCGGGSAIRPSVLTYHVECIVGPRENSRSDAGCPRQRSRGGVCPLNLSLLARSLKPL